MQNLIFSLNATLPVFLVMVVGYALGQLGFLPPAFCKASDRLTFKVTLPLMLFLDMGSVDILHDFRPRFVLFCFAATLVGILTVWAGAKRFLKDKALVGEFVQAGYRSSAAVLGVVNTMGSVGQPPSVLGGMIGSALVGTFLGILLAYGVVEPLGGLVEQKTEDAAKELQCIKSTLLASMQGYNPATAIEFGRKVLFSTERPGFLELESHVKGKK